jgi:GntR family transcriptional regulator/MocR family aminotransferase
MILNRKSDIPLYMQIVDSFKQQILDGSLKASESIPSIRSLSTRYNISKTTVEKAYHQLLVEGFIMAYPKSGYYVSKINPLEVSKRKTSIEKRPNDYVNLNQSLELFDMMKLRKLYNACFYDYQEDLIKPTRQSGEPLLKEAIHKYITTERGCEFSANDLIISSGLQNQLTILSSLLNKKRIAYLVPLFNRAKTMLNDLGFDLIPCKTIDEILLNTPDLIYISPSNLYPTGDILPVSDRYKLIEYAISNHAYIIEDDYNHIYRYNAAMIPSIQGLAKGYNVIYINSFSRSYLVSMRLSFMILPNDLLKRYSEKSRYSQTVSKIDQLVMAEWILQGYHQKHLRKLSLYAKKQNEMILQGLNQLKNPNILRIYGLKSNLHILFEIKKQALPIILKNAKNHGIYVETFDELPNTLLVPYNHIDQGTFKILLKHLFIMI